VSLALSLFPLYLIVYSFIPKQFHPKKTDSVYAIDGNIKFSTLVSGIAGVLLMLVTLMGFGFDFAGLALIPVSFGTTFVLYSALMFFIVHFLLNRKFGKSEYQTEAPPYSPNELLSELASVAIPVVIVAGWLVLWSIISIVVTGSQVGITPQVLSGATLPRGLYTIILTLLLIPWFYAEFHWLSSTVGLTVDVHDPKGNLRKVILLLTHRLGGTLIVIALFYVPFLAGVQLGLIMFIALLMLPLTLFFALFALMTLWVGHVTRNALATALFNAFILAVIVAATFQLV
jgi:hypothetical protein